MASPHDVTSGLNRNRVPTGSPSYDFHPGVALRGFHPGGHFQGLPSSGLKLGGPLYWVPSRTSTPEGHPRVYQPGERILSAPWYHPWSLLQGVTPRGPLQDVPPSGSFPGVSSSGSPPRGP
jgi:hypothetical protein